MPIAALKKRLDIEAIEGSEQERVMRKPEKAGAIWKIFHPDDNGKIRDAIAEWKRIQVLVASDIYQSATARLGSLPWILVTAFGAFVAFWLQKV